MAVARVLKGLLRQPKVFRLIAGCVTVAAVILALVEPVRLTEPDDWAYYFAVRNFSQGRLVIDDALHNQQVVEARTHGGELIQYVRIGPNQWALEKAPGAVFYIVPFQILNVSKAASILLLLGAVTVTYVLLRRLRNEITACIGVVLLVATPVTLTMLLRTYMDTIYDSAFLFIGGGFYIYCMIRQSELKSFPRGALMFLAFFCISWSVVARYTNFPVAAVFALHYLVARGTAATRHRVRLSLPELTAAVLGVGIPAALLLGYHSVVFGSPFNYGYNYSQLPIKFAYQYLGQTDAQGNSVALNVIAGNLRNMPLPLLIGFPLLAVAVPGIFFILYQKLSANPGLSKPDPWWEITWDIVLLLLAWVVCVFGLYMLYEWTATPQEQLMPFIIKARFYLPGLLPLVIFTSLLMTRWSGELVTALLVIIVISGFAISLRSSATGLGKRPVIAQPVQPSTPPRYQVPSTVVPQVPQTLPALINNVRRQVKLSPTNEQNLQTRFNVLMEWTVLLSEQGFDVKEVMPPDRLWRIQSAILSGNLHEAAAMVDAAYGDMERAFGNMLLDKNQRSTLGATYARNVLS